MIKLFKIETGGKDRNMIFLSLPPVSILNKLKFNIK